jgi:hypothetical protein
MQCYTVKAKLPEVNSKTIYQLSDEVLRLIYYVNIKGKYFNTVASDKKTYKITKNEKYEAIYYLLEKYLNIGKDKLYARETALDTHDYFKKLKDLNISNSMDDDLVE